MRSKVKYTQADVARLIKGIEKSGHEVGKIEVDHDGKIIAHLASENVSNGTNEWDEVLK
jgi:isoaspartyl peptidase/L-asparaginase-like protein (Ntn-hydrolase superfamily)